MLDGEVLCSWWILDNFGRKFLEDSNAITSLKLRGSYGELGNNQTQMLTEMQLISLTNNYSKQDIMEIILVLFLVVLLTLICLGRKQLQVMLV
jgi:hypothetical protein